MRISECSSDVCSSDLVSSEKSSCPGVSSRLKVIPSFSNVITDDVTEIPRCCSIFIQSERARRFAPRALTSPARWIAPPATSSFSVSVVLPASGRSEEHTSELQSLMRISYAVFCLKKKNKTVLTNDSHSHSYDIN